jgi:hypothetical protein
MRVGDRHKKRVGVDDEQHARARGKARPARLILKAEAKRVSTVRTAPTAPTQLRLGLRKLRNMEAAMKPAAWVIGAVIVVAVLVRRSTRARKGRTGSRPIAGVGTAPAGVVARLRA